jgi:hypothetical protein
LFIVPTRSKEVKISPDVEMTGLFIVPTLGVEVKISPYVEMTGF